MQMMSNLGGYGSGYIPPVRAWPLSGLHGRHGQYPSTQGSRTWQKKRETPSRVLPSCLALARRPAREQLGSYAADPAEDKPVVKADPAKEPKKRAVPRRDSAQTSDAGTAPLPKTAVSTSTLAVVQNVVSDVGTVVYLPSVSPSAFMY